MPKTNSNKTHQPLDLGDFTSVRLGIASPERILKWSHGEVLKPETINYRTQKPEREGLFDEKIFGPTKDWECYCGKYKKIRYKGVICDKCGVEVTRSAVRRERLGHIELASPVAHIWYVRGVPSVLSMVLDLSVTDLERIVYFATFVTLEVDGALKDDLLKQLEEEYGGMKKQYQGDAEKLMEVETLYRTTKQELGNLHVKQILSEAEYHQISVKYGNVVRVGIGAEALLELLEKMDLGKETEALTEQIEQASDAAKKRLLKRLKALLGMKKANIRPEWTVLRRVPVIPPDLRPMVQLDGGRFAASDLNDLYRRVINRNNRLKKLLSRGAPEIICRNEKRMLQESVDALIDNSARHGRAVSTGGGQRRLRSLSDMLRGKQGRFRQNLLGKRVDYSGRSVIVAGPSLGLDQCGIPKVMALELFKPFVIGGLIREGHVHNMKNATRMIEKGEPQVWDILEGVIKDRFVLLNRAPTLHRLGIQAFRPVLIEGKALQLHPLVCEAYNADFDGDQMAVHLPLSGPAQAEARDIMQSTTNLLKPASGEPVVSPRLDMVFGAYYMTTYEDGAVGENKVYASKNEAILAYQKGFLHPRAKVKVRMSIKEGGDEELVETSVGRILFNNALPKELRYKNEAMDSKTLRKLVRTAFNLLGQLETAKMVDKIKDLGYEHATLSGMTFAMSDLYVPESKQKMVNKAAEQTEMLRDQYHKGLITDDERRSQTIRLWESIRDRVGEDMFKAFDPNSPVYISVTSGARGSATQLIQMSGMKGLVVNPSGEIIETAITSSFKEGFSELEYFVSTHGARKGVSDTALRTADAGYLTRRLVDVAQDIVVANEDCKTTQSWTIYRSDSEEMGIDFADRVVGRVAADTYKQDKAVIVKKGTLITDEIAQAIQDSDLAGVAVRSPLYCLNGWGICQACYGRDLATGEFVALGEAVGIIAAQAIGEPGTQLTLKTFHTGGVSGEDITTGLPRVEELFEARHPKSPAVISEISGQVKIRKRGDQRFVEVTSNQIREEVINIPKGYTLNVENGESVKIKQAIAVSPAKRAIRVPFSGQISIGKDNKVTVKSADPIARIYQIGPYQTIKINDSDAVVAGDALTEGHLDLQKTLGYKGAEEVHKYVISEIQDIYNAQGSKINDKHLEIILRQMFSKVKIVASGDSDLLENQVVDQYRVRSENEKLKKAGKRETVSVATIFGVSRIAVTTESFLSAASFQETTGVLIKSAIAGATDELKGLKENVIIGRLIPAGTGFNTKRINPNP